MDTQRPAIFTLIAVPIIGKLGRNSKVIERRPCKACGVSYREEVKFLDYEFDTWERAELIKAGHDNYAITHRLLGVFEKAGLKGMAAQAMQVSRGRILDQIDPENKIKIPEFMRLIITGRADGPSGWWSVVRPARFADGPDGRVRRLSRRPCFLPFPNSPRRHGSYQRPPGRGTMRSCSQIPVPRW